MALLKEESLFRFRQNRFWNYPYSLIELPNPLAKGHAQTNGSDAMVIPMFIVERQL
jgi:hypothetical protein